MNWKPFDTAPEEGRFLVYMPEEKEWNNTHVMVRKPYTTATIGNRFAFDFSKPTLWCEIPTLPEGEDNAPEW